MTDSRLQRCVVIAHLFTGRGSVWEMRQCSDHGLGGSGDKQAGGTRGVAAVDSRLCQERGIIGLEYRKSEYTAEKLALMW